MNIKNVHGRVLLLANAYAGSYFTLSRDTERETKTHWPFSEQRGKVFCNELMQPQFGAGHGEDTEGNSIMVDHSRPTTTGHEQQASLHVPTSQEKATKRKDERSVYTPEA